MINQAIPSVFVYTSIAVACTALVALTATLLVLCRKGCRGAPHADPDEESGTTAILHARSHSLSDVSASTDGFHPALVLGSGRLGTVYVATSPAGELLAMKRVHPHLVLGNAAGLRFSSRIRSLSFSSRHPNVVPILGYSEAPGERIVITEFVGGMRSLDRCLYGADKGGGGGWPPPPPLLDWGQRVRIAAGAARGLEHLHSEQGVVHGRVKPSNVMVDERCCAKVCDYGLSFLSPGDRRGMEGYMDGEGREEASKANDVYGFGVVLLELLSGRRCEEEWGLLPLLIRGGRVGEVLDGRLGLPKDMQPLVRMAKVASACVGNGRRSRPTMSQVAAILSSLELEGRPCS